MTTPTLSRIKVMSAEVNAIGLQFVGEIFEDWRWNGVGGYHQLVQQMNPAFVNFMAAGQREQAIQRALAVQHHSPQTRILWRHMRHQPPSETDNTDRNMWRLPSQEYVDNVIVAHGYHNNGWYNVTDNEGSINSIAEAKLYAGMQASVLDIGTEVGARFAVLRTSTHNPPPEWIMAGYFDELFRAVARNMGSYEDPKVILSMNAYYDDHPEYGNDALLHIKTIEDRFIKVTGRRPVICLGEFGYDRGFTSEGGWHTTAMSAETNAILMVSRFNKYLGPHGYTACGYCEGIGQDAKVKNFTLTPVGIRVLIGNNPKWIRLGGLPDTSPPVEPEPPVIVKPSPDAEPPKEDDTVEIERPDRLREAQERLKLRQAQVEALRSERLMIEAHLKWLDKRAQVLQSELILAEIEMEQLNEAVEEAA